LYPTLIRFGVFTEENMAHHSMKPGLATLTFGVAWLTTIPAYAHHEAIFGPQSSTVLSAGTFASAQVFTREIGSAEERTRETTTVFSGGLQPSRRPLSVALVVPLSFVSSVHNSGTRTGFEDALVSIRYRVESERFTQSLGVDESYFMGVGGVELPTGTLDHEFGRGPIGSIAAGLMNVEMRPFSVIGYGYYHHAGRYRGARESGNLFVGAGGAWTPVDDAQSGRLVSLQLGASYERTSAEQKDGRKLPESGGSGLFIHPGIVWGANEHVQLFALVSLPVAQQWRASDDRQRFRFGTGVILILAH
jgi:hypothetical protein